MWKILWKNGQYQRTRDLAEVKEGFAEQLRLLGTDYLDIGMTHYVDALSDWEMVISSGIRRVFDLDSHTSVMLKVDVPLGVTRENAVILNAASPI